MAGLLDRAAPAKVYGFKETGVFFGAGASQKKQAGDEEGNAKKKPLDGPVERTSFRKDHELDLRAGVELLDHAA